MGITNGFEETLKNKINMMQKMSGGLDQMIVYMFQEI